MQRIITMKGNFQTTKFTRIGLPSSLRSTPHFKKFQTNHGNKSTTGSKLFNTFHLTLIPTPTIQQFKDPYSLYSSLQYSQNFESHFLHIIIIDLKFQTKKINPVST